METRFLVDKCERLFPGALFELWKGLVFHPGPAFLDKAIQGHAIFPSDVADVLLKMQEKGWIRPVAFRPDHSQKAFLGLQYSSSCDLKKKPNAGTAAAWSWECLIEPQADLKEYMEDDENDENDE